MKKLLSLALTFMMAVTLLTGCGSDPILEDLEQYLNVDMNEVNGKYDIVKTESGNLANMESVDELLSSVNDTILPAIYEAIDLLAAVEPETAEVKTIKEKYESTFLAYKEGFEMFATALETEDENLLDQANTKIEEGLDLLNDYNAALEELAAEYDMEIQY